MPVIGFLSTLSPDTMADQLRAFRQGLKDTGYVEGENVAIDYLWAESQLDQCQRWRPNWSADGPPDRDGIERRVRSQGGNRDDPNRLHHRRRPGQARTVASLARPGNCGGPILSAPNW